MITQTLTYRSELTGTYTIKTLPHTPSLRTHVRRIVTDREILIDPSTTLVRARETRWV